MVVWIQLPRLSPNVLKSHFGGGGVQLQGGVWIQLLTFDAQSKSTKIPPVPFFFWGGVQIQLATFDADSKSAKNPKSHLFDAESKFAEI